MHHYTGKPKNQILRLAQSIEAAFDGTRGNVPIMTLRQGQCKEYFYESVSHGEARIFANLHFGLVCVYDVLSCHGVSAMRCSTFLC